MSLLRYLFPLFTFLPLLTSAQVMTIDKKVLYADGEKVMTITRHGLGTSMHFKCLAHDKAIVCVGWETNGTRGNSNDDCRRIEFLGKGLVMYTKLKISLKDWAGLMYREGALNEDWEVDEEGARAFIEKYGMEKPIPAYGEERREWIRQKEREERNRERIDVDR